MTVVLIDESGENKQDTAIPVPAPVKNLQLIFMFIMPIALSLSIDCTIFESSFNNVSREISN